jgi:lipopolysaccharide transport system ATP-binding protein
MAAPIISVSNLGKRYQLGAALGHDTLRDHLADSLVSLKNLFRGNVRASTGGSNAGPAEIWALKEVSFDVMPGEVVGIIGRNGAGKSTLLKILSQITEPTCGEIRIKGRLASLLEVGTGFHPELTGRENIFLNGAVLGMSQAEVRKKFEEIVAFAEVEKFLDTPVKRYSSGMYVRLAFAVAAHLEPEILVVDEVLAVGDAAFQAKCLAKMGDVARQGGRTVLFVSHNMQAVRSLCQRSLLLENGRLVFGGETQQVVNRYLANAGGATTEAHWSNNAAPGNHEIKLLGVRVYDESNNCSGVFPSSNRIFVEMEFVCNVLMSTLTLGFDLVTPDGETILRTYQTDQEQSKWPPLKLGRQVWRCELPARTFNYGSFLICPKINRQNHYMILDSSSVAKFEVVLDHGVSPFWNKLKSKANRPGLLSPILPWREASEPVSANQAPGDYGSVKASN